MLSFGVYGLMFPPLDVCCWFHSCGLCLPPPPPFFLILACCCSPAFLWVMLVQQIHDECQMCVLMIPRMLPMFNLVYSPPPLPLVFLFCQSVSSGKVLQVLLLCGFDSTHFSNLDCCFVRSQPDLDTMAKNDRIVHNIYTQC